MYAHTARYILFWAAELQYMCAATVKFAAAKNVTCKMKCQFSAQNAYNLINYHLYERVHIVFCRFACQEGI